MSLVQDRRAATNSLQEGALPTGLVDTLVAGVHAAPDAPRMTTIAPFTGEPLFSLPVCTGPDVADAFDVARTAQARWAARPVRERARIVGRLHDLLLTRQAEVLDLLQLECGKARLDAYSEVFAAAAAARYYSRSAPRLLQLKRRRGLIPGATRAHEARQPKGVIGLTTAWNFPIVFAAVDGFPALVAGNAIVHRPDHKGAVAVLWLRSLAIEAGVPGELWQVVLGPGRMVGNAVTDHADYVSFTGSTQVGREVSQRAGRRLIGCSLELGGKNPLLVLADADVEKAAAGAVRASFTNTGQACVGTERILVADEVHDRFVAAFLARVRRLRVGVGLSFEYDMGSLIDQAQFDQVTGHISDAVAKGAAVLHEGRPRPDLGPFVHEPTVLAGVRHGMRVRDEETFGPVVSIERFHTEDEAVASANDTPYGLAASIWSRNVPAARRLAQRLHAGGVDINEYYGATWGSIDLPQGGMKDSGLGRRNGRDGLLRFTEAQAIASQHLHGIHPPRNLGNGEFAQLLTTTLKALHKTGRA